MDKKTKIIVFSALAIMVLGSAFYGFNRWRQQRLANQILKNVYGLNGGTGLLGGGSIPEQIAQQMANEAAKEEMEQKEEEAREAAKTPEDRFNEAKETPTMGTVSSFLNSDLRPGMEAVFGKAKMTSYGSGMYGGPEGFVAIFKVPRIVTAEDLGELADEFEDKGFVVGSTSVESDSGNLMMTKGNELTVSFSFSGNGEGQEVEVLYMDLSAE